MHSGISRLKLEELDADLASCYSLQSYGTENTNWRCCIDVVLNRTIYWPATLLTDGGEVPNCRLCGDKEVLKVV